MKVSIPIRTVSSMNAREHWAKRARRNKQERTIARMLVRDGLSKESRLVKVVLTRKGPRLLDSDNLAGSFKSIRDGIADALGIDDGSDSISWEYRQEKSKSYSVEIEIN